MNLLITETLKKALNYAIRNIRKRNFTLNKLAINFARPICEIDSKASRLIAFNELKELENEAVQKKLEKR